MHTLHHRPLPSRRRGFSLVELLTAVGIIGILASLSLAAMSGVNDTSRVTAARANAQRIAATFSAGLAAGSAEFGSANSVDSAMDKVGDGDTGAGSLSNVNFQLNGISSDMDEGKPLAEQAKTYLSWDGRTLVYSAAGGGGGGGSASPSAPPANWTALSAADLSNLIIMARNNTGNQSITPQGAVAWFNAQPNQPVRLMEQDGVVYYTQPTQGSGGSSGNQL